MTKIEKMKNLKILNNLKTDLEVSCDNLENLFSYRLNQNDDFLFIKTYLTNNKTDLSQEMMTKYGGRKVLLSPLKPRINYDNITIYFMNSKQQEISYTINEIINNNIKLQKYEDVVFTYINNDMYIYESFYINSLTNFFTNDELYRLQRMLLSLEAEYEPLENTDVYEDYSESLSQSESEKNSQSNHHTESETNNGNVTGNNGHNYTRNNNNTNSASDTNQVVAFNNNNLTDAGKNINSLSSSEGESLSESEQHSESSNSTHSQTANDNITADRQKQGYQTIGHTLHRHGNIGVTTNQQMITSELDLRGKSFYDIIINVIADKILLKVY